MSNKVLSISAVLLLSTGIASAEVPKVSADIAPVHSLVSKVMNGLGLAILSTPKGVMSDEDARKNNVGGEIICRVF